MINKTKKILYFSIGVFLIFRAVFMKPKKVEEVKQDVRVDNKI